MYVCVCMYLLFMHVHIRICVHVFKYVWTYVCNRMYVCVTSYSTIWNFSNVLHNGKSKGCSLIEEVFAHFGFLEEDFSRMTAHRTRKRVMFESPQGTAGAMRPLRVVLANVYPYLSLTHIHTCIDFRKIDVLRIFITAL